MASNENVYGIEHLLGFADLPRNSNPQLRGTVRRSDPDGGSSVPYFSGLNTKTLTVNVTPVGDLVLTFTSDGYQDAIDYINTVSPANLYASDEDGYLVLTNLNGGSKNTIQTKSGTAASILGFRTQNYPGSISYAGEVGTSSSGRLADQNNPHGTALLSGDEDLNSGSLNKAIAGFAHQLYRRFGTTDVEIPVVEEIDVTVSTHTTGGSTQVFHITDDSIRIPVIGVGFTGTSPTGRELDSIVCLLDATTGEPVADVTETENLATVLNIFYEAGDTNTLDDTALFAAWGTPDGKSIFDSTLVKQRVKHAAATISAIDGDVIYCSGATFVTNVVQEGDTLEIESADNNIPFNHNGEYIITEVIGEELVRVRHATTNEALDATEDRPTTLNTNLPGGTSYGTAKVLIGKYIPASDIVCEVPSWVSNGAYKARILTGRKLSDLTMIDLSKPLRPRPLGKVLGDHVQGAYAGTKHPDTDVTAASKSSGPYTLSGATVAAQLDELLEIIDDLIAGEVTYSGGIPWVDGSTNPSRSLEAQVDDMLVQLADTPNDGADKIRALASSPLLGGSIRDQLDQLASQWFRLQDDETVIGETTFQEQVNIGDTMGDTEAPIACGQPTGNRRLLWRQFLGGDMYMYLYAVESDSPYSGGYEIAVNALWSGSLWSCPDNSARAVVYRFETENLKILSHTATAGTWNDTSWTMTRVDFDYSALTGAGSLVLDGYFETSQDATVKKQLVLGDSLLGSEADAKKGRIVIDTAPTSQCTRTRVLLTTNDENADDFDVSIWRVNATNQLEFVFNAEWDEATSKWSRQTTGQDCAKVVFDNDTIRFYRHDSATMSPWLDTMAGWEQTPNDYYAVHKLYDDTPLTAQINCITRYNQVKAWGLVETNGTAAPTLHDGFNCGGVMADATKIQFFFYQYLADYTEICCITQAYEYGTGRGYSLVYGFEAASPCSYVELQWIDNSASIPVVKNPGNGGQSGLRIAVVVFGDLPTPT